MEQKLCGGVFFHEYGIETKVANSLFPVFPHGYDHVHRDRIFFMQSDMTPLPSFSEIFFSNRHLQ